MTDAELAAILSQASTQKSIRRRISSRRYNVEVFIDGQMVEKIEWISTYKRANDIANEYRKSGAKCNIREDVTFDGNGNEMKFSMHDDAIDNRPTGRISFTTPAMTRNRELLKQMLYGKPRPKRDNKRPVRISNPEMVPGTMSWKIRMQKIKQNGYTVRENGILIHCGLYDDTRKFLLEYSKTNPLSNLEVNKMGN